MNCEKPERNIWTIMFSPDEIDSINPIQYVHVAIIVIFLNNTLNFLPIKDCYIF